MQPSVKYVQTKSAGAGEYVEVVAQDAVAIEEPMEIRLRHYIEGKPTERSLSITMRTPGDDHHLAVGFLFTEGIIQSAQQILNVAHCGPPNIDGLRNVVKVTLAEDVDLDLGKLMRNFYTTSSCGVCGKSSLEALKVETQYQIPDQCLNMRSEYLLAAPELLRENQSLFDLTGGIHAAGLFNSEGQLKDSFEDVGRHNAVDKLIGAALRRGDLPLSDHAIMLSGRASFELLQKSMMAGIPVVAAVGAPSSLAVECAEQNNITLIGFLRGHDFNIYSHPQRILRTELTECSE